MNRWDLLVVIIAVITLPGAGLRAQWIHTGVPFVYPVTAVESRDGHRVRGS